MAVTRGHGNPNWTRDETILALELLHALGDRLPSKSHLDVIALSKTLRALPFHANAEKNERFRNPDGVAFKLMNLRQVATGRGLGNVSRTDREVWAELGGQPDIVRTLARAIREGAGQLSEDPLPSESEEFFEGRILTSLHYRRERNPKLRQKLIAKRRALGLSCDMCGLKRPDLEAELEEALFEAHHIKPLSASGETTTKVSDLALLCACCHRVIHRMIAVQKIWISVNEAAKAVHVSENAAGQIPVPGG